MNAVIQLVIAIAMLGMAGMLLFLNFWRAVLFFFPDSVRVRPVAPGDAMGLPLALTPLASQLRALGFVPLGAHEEKPRFRRATRAYDFAHPTERAFATLHFAADGKPRLYLLTPLAPEGFVLTFGYPRPGFEVPGRYRSGGLAETSPERLLRAHQERLQGLVPTEDFSQDARLRAGQAWYRGPGQKEIRRQNVQGVLWTVVALAIVASLFLGGGRST
ncbi:hypothetical protein [Archangium sp.]|jgi:hypothetical protein|uniref:hypothetical protein n=1 Tax=Archangium sp. TaxID=1872627 RepID=UPI002EDB2E13